MDAVLGADADGLQFFATFLPRAALVSERAGTGDALPSYAEIEARYYEQRDIRLDALAADLEVVTRVAADIERQCDDQERIRLEVAQAWQGAAADSADRYFGEYLRRAARLRQDLDAVRCALVETDRVLRAVAARKAEWVAGLDPTHVCGRTAAEVDGIVGTAVNFGESAEEAANWAVDVFLARVRDTTAQFVDLCDAAESTVDGVFRDLDAAFCAIDDSAFPTPAQLGESCPGGVIPPREQPCPQPPPVPAVAAASAAASATVSAPVAGPAAASGSLTGLVSGGVGVAGTQVPGVAVPVAGFPPASPGSLAIEDTVRVASALVGVVAEVALDVVADVIVEVVAARETGSLDLEPPSDAPTGCACECAGDCTAEAPEQDAPPAPEPEPEPEPAPEPQCPEPVAAEPQVAVNPKTAGDTAPVPEPAAPEPADPGAEYPAPADYCVPTEDPQAPSEPSGAIGSGRSNPVRGAIPPVSSPPSASGASQPPDGPAVDPTLAEAGPASPREDEQGVALAEAGSL